MRYISGKKSILAHQRTARSPKSSSEIHKLTRCQLTPETRSQHIEASRSATIWRGNARASFFTNFFAFDEHQAFTTGSASCSTQHLWPRMLATNRKELAAAGTCPASAKACKKSTSCDCEKPPPSQPWSEAKLFHSR